MGAHWFDQALAVFAPERALRAAQARQALLEIRAYEGAKRTRRTEGWRSGNGSANAEINGALSTLRDRSRELVRNNPYARRAINVLVGKSIGTGILARVPDGAKSAMDEFVDKCDVTATFDFYGLQSLIARTAFESGGCLVRRIRTTQGRIPLKLQVLEPDYIDTTKYGTVGDNYIIAGIEINGYGARVAYWLYDQHPGESAPIPRRLQSQRIDASEIIYFGERERPGQLHCVPRLATTMLRFRDHDDWRDAVLLKKKIEACFVAFVHGSGTSNTIAGSGQIETQTDGKRIETLSPGMIHKLRDGEEVSFGNPSAAVDGGFNKDELHAMAVGTGVTYEQLTGDLSQVNFSSMRAGMNDFIDMVEMYRWIQFIPQVLKPIREWAIEAGWTAGSLRSRDYAFIWTPPAWPYVNPVDDIKALKEMVLGGVQSLSEGIRQRGYNPDDVFDEIARERKSLAEKGIKVDTDIANAPTRDTAAAPGKKLVEDDEKDESKAARMVDVMSRHADALQIIATRETPHPVINVSPADVTVNINEGAVRVDSPVTIAEGAVRVESPVQFAEGAVIVEPANVDVTVNQRGAVERTVTERDKDGLIVRSVEKPLDEQAD